MKKLIVFAFVMALFVITQAQEKRLPGQGSHPGMGKHFPQHMMAEKLKLSEDQQQKAKALNEQFRKNMMDLRKNEDITVREWKNQMQSFHKKHREDMQALLSKEQKMQIEKMKLERKQMREIDAKARMEKMKIHLGLSNEQADKLKNQRAELMQQMKALHENQSLDQEKKREEMRTLMQKQREEMKSILTEEQLNKMKEMRKHRPHGKLS